MKNGYKNYSQESEGAKGSLTESEELMCYIVRYDPNAIAIFDAQLHYMAVSERYLADYKVKEATIIGKHHYEVFPEMSQNWKEVHQRCLAGAIESSEDDSFERPDGSITYNRWECRPWRRINGQIGGIILYTEVTTDRKKAEKALVESEIKYHAFFENSMDAILLTCPDGNIHSANPAAYTLFGYSEEELIKVGKQGIEDKTDSRLSVLLAERKRNGKAQGEVTFVRKDGTRFAAEISSSIFQNNEGLERTSMIIRDITERKAIQNELKFKADLLNQVGQAVIATDEQNQITYWNSAAEKIYGWSSVEAMGQNLIGLIPTETTWEQAIEIRNHLSNGKPWSGELLVKRKDGFHFPAFFNNTPMLDSNGKLTGVIGISSDITERKLAEQSLLESEERFRHSFDYAAAGMCLVGLDEKFLRVNKTLIEMIGYDQDELKHLTIRDISYPEDSSIGLEQLHKMLAGEIDHASFEKRYQRKDHSIVWGHVSQSIIRDVHQEPQFFIAQVVDITQGKQAEVALRTSETHLRTLIQTIPDLIWLKDGDGVYLSCNSMFERFFGASEADIIGKTDYDLVEWNLADFFRENDRIAMEAGIPTTNEEWITFADDGHRAFLETIKTPMYNSNNTLFGVLGIGRDLTERKRTEEAMRKSEAHFKAIFNEAPLGIALIDSLTGHVYTVNPMFAKITDRTVDEMTNIDWMSITHPDDVQDDLDNMALMNAGKISGFQMEKRYLHQDGTAVWINMTIAPIYVEDKDHSCHLCMIEDITDRKQAEEKLNLANEELVFQAQEKEKRAVELIIAKVKAEESDRLKSAFLANMSHEVRTPLNSIIGFSELLGDPDFEPEQKKEFIDHIVTSGNHLLTIISDIMDISRMESGEVTIHKSQVNAQHFMVALGEQFTFQAEAKNLELQLILPDTDTETLLETDAARLNQIFNNLISNAIKFTAKGQIAIGFHHKGQLIEFFVRDTGIGIPEKYHDKIFERFRQVEDAKTRTFGGNGLGLAISKNLVELMGGKIWVKSEPGIGSTFYFTIPVGRG